MKLTIVGHDQLSARQYLLWHKVRSLGLAEVQILAPERWRDEVADPKMVTPVKTGFQGNIMNYMMNVEPHIAQFEPDWIISMTEYWRQQSLINLQSAKRHGIKIAFFRWENLPLDDQIFDPYRTIEHTVLEHADLLICGNLKAETLTKARTNVPIVRLLETGIDTDTFTYREDSTDTNTDRILYIGRMSPEKGIGVIKEATEGYNMHFGSGDLPYEELPKLMRESAVGVVGSIDQPYWTEQCCYVIGEMLACGLPVVSTDAGSIPEIWGSCRTVYLVPQNDPKEMRRSIERVLREHPDRPIGPRFICENYSNEALARKYVEALQT